MVFVTSLSVVTRFWAFTSALLDALFVSGESTRYMYTLYVYVICIDTSPRFKPLPSRHQLAHTIQSHSQHRRTILISLLVGAVKPFFTANEHTFSSATTSISKAPPVWSAMERTSIAVFRLPPYHTEHGPAEPSSAANTRQSPSPTHQCGICAQVIEPSSLVAQVSCCNSIFHIDCFSTWTCNSTYSSASSISFDIRPDTRRTVSLPNCSNCRATFEPTGLFTALAHLATGQVTIPAEPTAATQQVRRLEVVVTEAFITHHGLRFEPQTLARQALRSENMEWQVEEEDTHSSEVAEQDEASRETTMVETEAGAASTIPGNSSGLGS